MGLHSFRTPRALKEMQTSHDTSTPHRSETNGKAEAAVRRVTEGSSCALDQANLDEKWYKWAVATSCFLRSVNDKLHNGKTTHEMRFGRECVGPKLPFGATGYDNLRHSLEASLEAPGRAFRLALRLPAEP